MVSSAGAPSLRAPRTPEQLAYTTLRTPWATDHLAALLAIRLPQLPPDQPQRAARVALTAVMALLGLITAEKALGSAHSEALLAETHSLLAAYLGALEVRAAGAPEK